MEISKASDKIVTLYSRNPTYHIHGVNAHDW